MRSRFLMGMLGLALSAVVYAQQVTPNDRTNISEILEHMRNGDLHTQKLAFDNLMTRMTSDAAETPENARTGGRSEIIDRFFAQHPEQADQIKRGLIQLLNEENSYFIESKNPPPDPNEEDDIGEHYAELIDTVSSLHDERTIPALVGAMTTGGMAQRGLMKYGDKALEPVLAQLQNSDALVRATALGVGIALLQKANDPTSQIRIRDLIRSSLSDARPVVRSQAIKEIVCLNNRQDFVPILQQIAQTDQWKLPGKADDGGDGNEFYPVRFDARRVLQDINAGRTCTP